MKRLHIHIGVNSIEDGIRFYSALFNAEPAKVKADYAKWMLEDPRLNFAISTRTTGGVDHLGFQVNTDDELAALRDRLQAADISTFDEGETVCCYARSDKSWITDPAGVAWEAYKTMEDVQLFSDKDALRKTDCCAPKANVTSEEKSGSCCD